MAKSWSTQLSLYWVIGNDLNLNSLFYKFLKLKPIGVSTIAETDITESGLDEGSD